MKRAVLSACVAVMSSWCGLAAGQQSGTAPEQSAPPNDATRIVLVTGTNLDELGNRFAAELGSLHFEVVRVADGSAALAPSALEALAVAQSARAAVRVAAVEGAVDLWLVNPATHEVVYRRIVAERDAAVAVLRSLEILRGSLIDLRALAPKPPPAPSPAHHEAIAGEHPTAFLGLHVAATSLNARTAPAVGALATLHLAVTAKLRVHTEALLPLSQWQVVGEGGRVKTWALGVAVGGSVAPWGERTVTPTLGLGLGLLALHTRGEASPGFRGSSDLNLAAFPHAELGATLKVAKRLRVRAQISSGFAMPRPVLLFADARNTAWVNPLLLGALGLELALN